MQAADVGLPQPFRLDFAGPRRRAENKKAALVSFQKVKAAFFLNDLFCGLRSVQHYPRCGYFLGKQIITFKFFWCKQMGFYTTIVFTK